MAEIKRINKNTVEYVADGKPKLNPELQAFLESLPSEDRDSARNRMEKHMATHPKWKKAFSDT